MRKSLSFILCLALLVGCQATDVRSYWSGRNLDTTDMTAAEEQFADFAELAVSAPQEDALAAMDSLFNRLKKDPVSYYIYSDWMAGAFYSILSPCRDAALFGKVVERMTTDGILETETLANFVQMNEWMGYNQEGSDALIPGSYRPDSSRTLVLILDLGCPSCRESLEIMAQRPEYSGIKKMAICLGYGPRPEVPGWEYSFPENATSVFDPNMTPVYFVVDAQGKVERGYTPAFDKNE